MCVGLCLNDGSLIYFLYMYACAYVCDLFNLHYILLVPWAHLRGGALSFFKVLFFCFFVDITIIVIIIIIIMIT